MSNECNKEHANYFLNIKSVVNQEFVPVNHIINAHFHCDVLRKLCKHHTMIQPKLAGPCCMANFCIHSHYNLRSVSFFFLYYKGYDTLPASSLLIRFRCTYSKNELKHKGQHFNTVSRLAELSDEQDKIITPTYKKRLRIIIKPVQ